MVREVTKYGKYCLHQEVIRKGFFTGGEDPLSKVSAGTW